MFYIFRYSHQGKCNLYSLQTERESKVQIFISKLLNLLKKDKIL